MPLPKTTDVGVIMHELKTSDKKRPRKQMVAIALSQARKSGAKIPKKRKHKSKSLKRIFGK